MDDRAMDLPVMPPILPMLAKSVPKVPTSGGYSFEPRWDARRQVMFGLR